MRWQDVLGEKHWPERQQRLISASDVHQSPRTYATYAYDKADRMTSESWSDQAGTPTVSYNGVNLVYDSTSSRQLEYTFQVQPGADASAIKMSW